MWSDPVGREGTCSCPVTIVNDFATPRCVTGMPAAAGTAIALVMQSLDNSLVTSARRGLGGWRLVSRQGPGEPSPTWIPAADRTARLLAAELGAYGIRVNGVNPDGVVRGSGIFAKGWGADRARVYGVPEDKLGEFYAQRTLLKREVLPDHVADAVFALTGGDLTRTTGLHVPVDSGVAAAFLR